MAQFRLISIMVVLAVVTIPIHAQYQFHVEGNGIFTSPASTNVDVIDTADNSNSLIRWGDNNLLKFSFGFNGNEDLFKVAIGDALSSNDFSLSPYGKLGFNAGPDTNRVLIAHNSTSGVSGSAHVDLSQNSMNGFARLRFENLGESNSFVLAGQAKEGNSKFKISYNEPFDTTELMTLDGDLFHVGIHQSNPEGYLHIKQQFAGIDALAIINDDATGGDKWSMRIGDEDILIYFNNDIRGGFDVSTGNYNNFPPPPPASSGKLEMSDDDILEKLNKVCSNVILDPTTNRHALILDPLKLQAIESSLTTFSEDGTQLGINYSNLTLFVIRVIQQKQKQIIANERQISSLKRQYETNLSRLERLERQLAE